MPATTTLDQRPHISGQEAEALAATHFDVSGAARALPSDRDQNFVIKTEAGKRFVLKVANAAEERAFLEAQNASMQHLAALDLTVPHVCATRSGASLIEVEGMEGRRHFVRLISYLSGVPLAHVKPHAPELLHDLGRFLGQVDSALAGFEHPGAHWDFEWDVHNASETIRARLDYIDDEDRRRLVERFLVHFEAEASRRLPDLPHSIIHRDANDYNILVNPPRECERRVAGLLDFGDMGYTVTVSELAIAAAYAMLDKPDPLAAAAHVTAGYHQARPLDETEIEVLFPLITMRLCISVCMSAHQKTLEPENDYLTISERPAWALLEWLGEVHPHFARYTLRHACGLEPCPQSKAVAAWLDAHSSEAAPIVEPAPCTSSVRVFDFSVGSTEWDTPDLTLPGLAAEEINHRLQTAGAAIGVGRYDEPRLAYTAPQFRTDNQHAERRTIHLGLDLFQPAGSPVFAPLDGVVHSMADNALPLDYGPTVILQHEPEKGIGFYTLYGHLSRASINGLSVGQRIEKGQHLGTLGALGENGGWAPHLHVQVIVDMLDQAGDFPGVALPSQRAVWKSLCPDPNRLIGIPAGAFPEPPLTLADIQQRRAKVIGPNLSVSYRSPLHIVRGIGPFLYDAEGRDYLDGVNNVAHVGHEHPRVVEAARRQMGVLNTNTRYLYEHLIRYAERLTATLPEPLSVCFFVNSGSEANDLALRLARAHTNRRDVVVLDGAYHGHLTSLIEISPYKFDGPGGAGKPPHTHVVPMPDPYRGAYRADDPEAGSKYAAHVHEAVEQAEGAAVFIAEPLLSCGGQIVLPEGFLRAAYRHVRAAAGVCIADEVQIGFGRVGTHFWGFETQGVVPDIVTMGKPIGNGHPLAAVVTTPEIAASFANGMEYFNTFGGNPVSCAVGLAVLDVIEEEGLQTHALRVGNYLMAGLKRLQERHPIIGDVRGIGLFVGIELVRDRETLEPAAEEASYIVQRMREHRILLSTDGPLHNVIKIKPPLVFKESDADRLVATLDAVLAEDSCRV